MQLCFGIKYRKGCLNQVCDALSRNPVFEPPTIEQEIQKDNELTICTVKTINIQLEQVGDDTHDKIYRYVSNFVLRIFSGSTPTFYRVLRSPSLIGLIYYT